MGQMFRSEDMVLVQLFIQPEAAYESVSKLGEESIVQFNDLNEHVNAFKRQFVGEIRRCGEMLRKLRYIEAEMAKVGIALTEVEVPPKAPRHEKIAELERTIDKTEKEIREIIDNSTTLKKNHNALTELMHVLENTEKFFEEAKGFETQESLARKEDLRGKDDTRGRLEFVGGVIKRERIPTFERMLWRVSRGNFYMRTADHGINIENPYTGVKRPMSVFVVFFQGEQLKSKVLKICQGFHAKVYQVPPIQTQRRANLQQVKQRLKDLEIILKRSKEHTHDVLKSVQDHILIWHTKVKKMKAIYHTLNLFAVDFTNNCLIGECWVPISDVTLVRCALDAASTESGSQMTSVINRVPTAEIPPTFVRTNRFTKGFQVLIDAYGISTFREVNPALYTIVTFPFLFAVMFGDVGHGLILALFGYFMVAREKKLLKIKSDNEIWKIFFAGRYIILLMGLFSIYVGFVYNDIFSKAMNIYGSQWKNPYDKTTIEDSAKSLTLSPKDSFTQTPYAFGVDPIWVLAGNKIIFANSYKMKLSIIFGVIHMIFGLSLSVVNYRYFNNRSSIYLEYIPQLLFLSLLFVYMVLMMFFKWAKYSCSTKKQEFSEGCAPSILIIFINMMLFTKREPEKGCKEYMFEGQGSMQRVFIIIALMCIPLMLLGKPMWILRQRAKQRKALKKKLAGTNSNDKSSEKAAKKEKKKKSKDSAGHLVVINSKPVLLGEDLEEDKGEEMKRDADKTMPEGEPEKISTEKSESKEEMVQIYAQHEHEEPFGEIMMHQVIHTIEYVLSTISHTASYLRLWALSLAHGELSEVLWNMVLRLGLQDSGYSGCIKIFIFFPFWAFFTLAILVVMEGLSAFLHTLRLHWVEFMSKFFSGQGYPFAPFAFTNLLDYKDDDEEKDKGKRR